MYLLKFPIVFLLLKIRVNKTDINKIIPTNPKNTSKESKDECGSKRPSNGFILMRL